MGALGVMAEALNLHLQRSIARVVDARSMSIFLPATTIVLRHANGATLMCRTMPAIRKMASMLLNAKEPNQAQEGRKEKKEKRKRSTHSPPDWAFAVQAASL